MVTFYLFPNEFSSLNSQHYQPYFKQKTKHFLKQKSKHC